MKRMKRHVVQLGMLLLFMLCANWKLQQVKAESVWNTNKTMTLQNGDFTFYAYPSVDGDEAWIYYIEVTKSTTTQDLVIPEKIDGMKVTKLDATSSPYGTGVDAYTSLFRQYVEPWHGADGRAESIKWIAKMTIPSTVEIIGKGAFSGMTSLSEVTLPESIKDVQECAFYWCSNLKQVTYPKKCKKINPQAFKACWKIEKLVVAEDNQWFQTKNDIIYDKKLTKVIWVAPAKKTLKFVATTKEIMPDALIMSKATKLVIPKALTTFSTENVCCPWLKKVEVDSKNKKFGWDKNTLYETKNHRLVLAIINNSRCDISDKVVVITSDACLCGDMNGTIKEKVEVHLPKSLLRVGKGWSKVFNDVEGCILYVHAQQAPTSIDSDQDVKSDRLNDIHLSKELLPAYYEWFRSMGIDDRNMITYFEGETVYGDKYTYILGSSQVRILEYNGDDVQVKIPEEIDGRKVTEIAKKAFYKGTMETISIPDTVVTIEEEAFAGCKNLYAVTLPEKLQVIGQGAFRGCKSLEEVELPDSLARLSAELFYGCEALQYVKLPAKLQEIGPSCFYQCKSLAVITFPEELKIINNLAFSGCDKLTEIHMPDSVNNMGSEVFTNCKNLKEVALSIRIISLPYGTFKNCSSLTTVTMRPDIYTVYQECFNGCSNLRSIGEITITGNVYNNAFKNCTKLESRITLGEQCGSVEENAFYHCEKATIVILASRLNSGNNAFLGCNLEYK